MKNLKKQDSSGLEMLPKILLSILMAFSMNVHLEVDNIYFSNSNTANYLPFELFITRCIKSFDTNKFLDIILVLLSFVLISKIKENEFKTREKVVALIFGVIFSIMQIIGRSYIKYDSWNAIFGSGFIIFRSLIVFIGMSYLSYCIILLLYDYMDALSEKEHGNSKKIDFMYCFKIAGIIFLCWLPYYIFFFPGTGNPDTSTQIQQFFHRYTYITPLSSVQGDNIFITNHHPFFTTLLYGISAKIGIKMGGIEYGVGLFVFFQTVFIAFSYSFVLSYLRARGLSHSMVKKITCFVALFPLFPLTAISMLKDPLFSVFCMLTTLFLIEIVYSKGKKLKNNKFCIVLFFNILLLELTKNQGVYIMMIVALVYLIYYRRYWKRIIITFIFPIILFQGIWINIILPACNVAPGGKQEVIGVLFQQTARYVQEYGNEVTDEEKKAINNVIDYDKLATLYDPNLSDSVKFTFNQKATSEQMSEYYKVWLEMLKKHPDVYIEATINGFYRFFYVESNSSLIYTGFRNHTVLSENDILYVDNPISNEYMSIVTKIIILLQRIPGFSIVFNMSIYVWFIAYYFFQTIRTKNYEYIMSGLIVFVSIGVLLISPSNGNFRYVMPLFYCIPLLFGFSILHGKNNEFNCNLK